MIGNGRRVAGEAVDAGPTARLDETQADIAMDGNGGQVRLEGAHDVAGPDLLVDLDAATRPVGERLVDIG